MKYITFKNQHDDRPIMHISGGKITMQGNVRSGDTLVPLTKMDAIKLMHYCQDFVKNYTYPTGD